MKISNLMKSKKRQPVVLNFNYWVFFLISALLASCSSFQ